MSSIEKMLRCRITGNESDCESTLRRLSDSGIFHMENANEGNSSGSKTENPYLDPLRQLSGLCVLTGHKFAATDYRENDLGQITAEIASMHERASELSDELKKINDQINSDTSFLAQISHLTGSSENTSVIDISQVFHCANIKTRFGKMPHNSFEKLDYYAENAFYFHEYGSDKDFCYGFVFTPRSKLAETERVLESLYFERIYIPEALNGDIRVAVSDLKTKIADEKKAAADCRKAMEDFRNTNAARVNELFTYLKTLYDISELRENVLFEGEIFTIMGYIPRSAEESFKRLFEDIKVDIYSESPPDDSADVPVKLKCSKFAEPFSMFVELYGLPSYKDLNPTSFLAVTYTLLFGIMFGDLGQGFLVLLLGIFLGHKKKMTLGRIMERLGVSSMIFGTLYGSVFGFEELLDPVYESLGIHFLPFHAITNINNVLYTAIGIGIVIILISIIINIIMGLMKKDYERALFSNNGIAGLVFYGSLLILLLGGMLGLKVGGTAYILLLIVLPLLVMFFKEPLGDLAAGKGFHIEGKLSDFIAANFFECFEYLLGFATNTLSFVRVGGFVLSHAGMMSVVLALSAMAGTASPIVMIIGNLFVMALEGLLSGIQVLRLEYYEMFSRYYNGGGKPFKPVKVNFSEMIS